MQKNKKVLSIFGLVLVLFSTFCYVPEIKAENLPSTVPQKDFEYSVAVSGSDYISKIEENDFAFTGISSKWGSNIADAEVYLRSGKTEKDMGDWSIVSGDNTGMGLTSDFVYGEIFNSAQDYYFQYRAVFTSSDIGKEFKIGFSVFDTSGQIGGTKISADSVGLGPKIISRAEWGANESYMKWPGEYSEVKAFVIHHTAGEEGAKVENQMSVVRNLYYGHAVSYGWGDIGYNYVIDVNGNIYEGRSGGGGVIAGHTLGYNSGTIGISLIGDYNVRVISEQQTQALADLIAYKSFQYGINPNGQVYLKDKTINTVVGHRDLNATLCPGTTIYGRVLEIATKAGEKLKTYPAKTNSAQFISSDAIANIYGGDTNKIKVSIKNTGNVPWQAQGANKLSISGSGGKLTANLEDFGKAIEPGQIGNFTLDVTAPSTNETVNQTFQTKVGGSVLAGGGFSISFNIATPEYRGRVLGKSPDQTLTAGNQATLWVDVKNVGKNSWVSSDAIKLYTLSGGDSRFYTAGDWGNAKNAGTFDSTNISPGSTGRISFVITAPSVAGQYLEKFVVRSDSRVIEGGDLLNVSWNIAVNTSATLTNTTPAPTVEPKTYSKDIDDYLYEFVNQSPYLTMNPGETKSLWLEVKNTGKTNWYKDIFHLATINDKESAFSNSSWLSKNRIAMNKDKVAPGETARFEFTVTAPATAGLTKEKFGLVAEGIGWAKDIGMYWDLTVNGSANTTPNSGSNTAASGKDDFAYVNQSSYLSMNAGETKQVWLEVKNTGSSVWKKDGASPVRLATANPRDRVSSFIPSNRVAMDKDTVNPGENVRFTFNITAPSTANVYKEYFTLVRDGVAWFNDIGIYWQITVSQANICPVLTPPAAGWCNGTVIEGGKDANGCSLPPICQTASSNTGTTLVSIPTSGNQIVKVSSNGPFIVVNSAETKIAEGGNGDVVTATYKDGKHYFRINSGDVKEASGWVRIVPWAVQTILTVDSYSDHPAWNQSINDNRFKGAIEVRYSTKNKKLWVIDDLNIEDYLKGVSEPLDSAGYEYVKSAVVAERSYVYNHLKNGGRWPDDGFTLKNSRNGNGDDQIYQGWNFTTRANNIPRAVDDTAGQVVTYNGNPVLTPYYTQSDGRTRSISEVWGSKQSDYPWLVSVPDPWCAGKQMLGHGVGMSGTGARGMANDGKTYRQILNYFYTGTDIGNIPTNRNVRIGIYSIDM